MPTLADLQKMTARYAPADIGADLSALAKNERDALARLIEASRIMDALFLRQVWAGNDAMLQDLAARAAKPVAPRASRLAATRLRYFLINKGPWDRLDHNRPFVPGAPPKPEGGNFYPPGATKADVQKWLDGLAGKPKDAATGFFTTIRRAQDGKGFVAVPYSIEYQGELARAADLLRDAAQLTGNGTLKKFLAARAEAFLTNDYYASDVAWMELDAAIEPTIGPYEVYEDEWFNAKAAFEAFITVRDEAESKKLQAFSEHLQELENNLPIDAGQRNPKLGAFAPIRVVNEIFAAGDANRGVQTAAFNLPNDERVVHEKGTKRVMLKNVQDAKFNLVLLPISKIALAAADRPKISFEAFFTHILMHELMHGLGPHNITVGVHDVPGVRIPFDPLRHQRGARQGDRGAAQLLPRRRCVQGSAGRYVYGRQREDWGRGHGADQRHHDAAGGGELRQGEGLARSPWRRPAGSAEGARSPDRYSDRHRATLHDRREAIEISDWRMKIADSRIVD